MSTEKDQPTSSKELPARYVTPQRVIDRLTGSAEVSATAMETAAFVIGNPPFSAGQSTQA